jgi:serine/threonine protein kinase
MQDKNIGEGTYSTVSKCTDTNGTHNIAIKLFKQAYDPNAINEIAILTYLCHPNIVQAVNIIILNGKCSIYMKCYDIDLAKPWRLEVRKHPMLSILIMLSCILDGADYLHKHLVVHCDLKPHNILMNSETMNVVICDFNIAKFNPDQRTFSGQLQTPGYRAPEIDYNHNIRISPKIDIWSIGCIMYELLFDEKFVLIPSNESSLDACRAFGAPPYGSRDTRMDMLKTMTTGQAYEYIRRRTKDICHQYLNKAELCGNDLYKDFVHNYITLMTKMLLPDRRYRYTSETSLYHFSTHLKKYMVDGEILSDRAPNMNHIPLFLMDNARECVSRSYNDILSDIDNGLSNNELLQIRSVLILEQAIMLKLTQENGLWARLLEVKYYSSVGLKKRSGTKESLQNLLSCIYIICNIIDDDDTFDAIHTKVEHDMKAERDRINGASSHYYINDDAIQKTAVVIMKSVGYKLII